LNNSGTHKWRSLSVPLLSTPATVQIHSKHELAQRTRTFFFVFVRSAHFFFGTQRDEELLKLFTALDEKKAGFVTLNEFSEVNLLPLTWLGTRL